LQIKINEALEGMKKELETKEEEINKRINEAVLKERKNFNARQKMDLDNLRKQHQKEIDVILEIYMTEMIRIICFRRFIKRLLIQRLIEHGLNHWEKN
jgi:hypothetical protein